MRHLPLVLGCVFLVGCPAAPPRVKPPSSAPTGVDVQRGSVRGTVVTGSVFAPINLVRQDGASLVGNDGASLVGNDGASLVGNDGASLVGNDGASLVGNDGASILMNGRIRLIGNDSAGMVAAGGGNLVGNDGASFRLAQAPERRIAGCPVYLADASGNPIPGLPAVETDASGRYTIAGVPTGFAFQVVAKARLADGRDASLTTLVRSTELGATAPIGAETTIATVAVLGGLSGPLGAYGEATYARIVEVAKKAKPADWTRLEAVAQEVGRLQAETAELKTLVGTMRDEIAQLRQNVADLAAMVASTAQATPAPTPVDAGQSRANLPSDLQAIRNFSPSGPEAGRWYLASSLPNGMGFGRRPYVWSGLGEGVGYKDSLGLDPGRVAGAAGTLRVSPGDKRLTLISWRPPVAGSLAWRFNASSAGNKDSIKVQVARTNLAGSPLEIVQRGTLFSSGSVLAREGRLNLGGDEALTWVFEKTAVGTDDSCDVTIDLTY